MSQFGQDIVFWNHLNIPKLINLLRQHRVIWDKKQLSYYTKSKREDAYLTIAAQLGTTKDKVCAKIKTLRCQWMKEYNKMKKQQNSKRPWKYFEHLKFLFEKLTKSDIENHDDNNIEFSKINDENKIVKLQHVQIESPNFEENVEMKLIKLLRQHELLWNPSHTNYLSQVERKNAYIDIANKLNTTSSKVRNKFHTLKSKFRQELQKIQQNENYKPTWEYFKHLRFFCKFEEKIEHVEIVQHRKEENEILQPMDEDKLIEKIIEEPFDLNYFDEEEIELNEIQFIEDYEVENLQFEENENQPYSELKKNTKNIAYLDDKETLNEFILYGERIAKELRLLKDHKTIQMELKCKIVRALLEANEEMQILTEKQLS